MSRDSLRNWGPPVAVLLSLPLVFAGLRGCLAPIGPRTPPPPAPASSAATASCEGCHPEQTARWSRSTHARAESAVPPEFDASVWAREGIAPPPVRAIGVAPVVQFLVPFDGGRLQVTDRAWDPRTGEWFSVFPDARQPGEWGHWTGGGMTWNLQCATCHSTGVVVGYDAAADRYATTALEHRVGCAACHRDVRNHAAGGPAPEHVASGVDGCAACHARRAELTGRWAPGEPFLDHFAPQLVDRTDAFWPDGQVREEDFEYTAFIGSKMYGAGVTCTSCHDPHSGERVTEGDALCLGCHASQPAFVAHDRHATGVGCAGCHLPETTYMQRDPRHDHGFRVPDPALNVRYGIPDACTRCHADRGAIWTAARAAEWYPKLARPNPRSEALARAHSGDAGAIPGLLSILADTRAGYRAAAADHLGLFLDHDDARSALVAAASDPDPLVRFAAVGALAGDPASEGALGDPVRAVRVQAQRGLRDQLSPTDARAADYLTYLQLNADNPAALHERGTWSLEQGRVQAAVDDLSRAVDRDPRSPAIREALALGLARAGAAGPAAEQLREAVRLAPTDGPLWYRLGLAEAGVGDLAAAERALTTSTEVSAGDARAWYNLGLVRNQLGADGRPALERAASLAPDDPEPLYALASSAWQAGDQARARDLARRVLALDPAHAGARSVLGAQ